jgi:3-methyladenine DNA glycosylase/8-oxoguanine DNA glycosylase
MVSRLVETFGEPLPSNPELRAFPTPARIATADESIFQTEIRMGYRNAYVLKLAREITDGQHDLEALKTSKLTYKELKKELKRIMGVGDYAAHTLLMILGRYDEVAVDSEFRSFVSKQYGAMSEKEMVALYEGWGRWKYLAYWFDAWE